jgi:zinc transport system substrate-binding protein
MQERVGARAGLRLARRLACAALALSLSRCPTHGDAPRLAVVATFYPVYIQTLNVVGDAKGVSVTCLAPAQTGCLHDYQVSPAALVSASRADAIVANGAGMETFLDELRRHAPRARLLDASEGIALLTDTHGGTNGHVWLSPRLAARQVRTIGAGLAAVDPSRAEVFRRNAGEYAARIEALAERYDRELRTVAKQPVVTFHEAFPYLARDLGLRIAGVIQAEPDSQPGARELAETIERIRREGVKVVFREPQYPAAAAGAVARETGARLLTLDPCVSGPPDPDSYLRAMEGNLRALKEAFAP